MEIKKAKDGKYEVWYGQALISIGDTPIRARHKAVQYFGGLLLQVKSLRTETPYLAYIDEIDDEYVVNDGMSKLGFGSTPEAAILDAESYLTKLGMEAANLPC